MDKALETPVQPRLITVDQQTTEVALELFPAVWQAAELLTSPEVAQRHASLDALLQSGAPRISPLIAYLLTTRLDDADIQLRVRVIEALSNLMKPDEYGKYAAEEVRGQLVNALSVLDLSGLIAVCEAGVHHPNLIPHISTLVNYCPGAGRLLLEIATDRKIEQGNRRLAIFLLGRLGYVDAIGELERLRLRIESRQVGQKSMPFAPPAVVDEQDLVPDLIKTISMLRAS